MRRERGCRSSFEPIPTPTLARSLVCHFGSAYVFQKRIFSLRPFSYSVTHTHLVWARLKERKKWIPPTYDHDHGPTSFSFLFLSISLAASLPFLISNFSFFSFFRFHPCFIRVHLSGSSDVSFCMLIWDKKKNTHRARIDNQIATVYEIKKSLRFQFSLLLSCPYSNHEESIKGKSQWAPTRFPCSITDLSRRVQESRPQTKHNRIISLGVRGTLTPSFVGFGAQSEGENEEMHR